MFVLLAEQPGPAVNFTYGVSLSATPATGPLTDYSPPGLISSVNRLLFAAPTGGTTINSLAASALQDGGSFPDGWSVVLKNTGTGNIALPHRAAGSAGNLFDNSGGTTVYVLPGAMTLLVLIYGIGWNCT